MQVTHHIHMRGPTRVLHELIPDLSSYGGFQASLDFVYFQHDLVEVEGWFITKADILRNTVETRQRVDPANHIAVFLLDMGHR